MKKLLYLFLAVCSVSFTACDDDNPTPPPVVEEQEFEVLEGVIAVNTSLDASKKYLLRGKVYVQAPNTLTIPAGTVIIGEKNTDGTLIIKAL